MRFTGTVCSIRELERRRKFFIRIFIKRNRNDAKSALIAERECVTVARNKRIRNERRIERKLKSPW